MGKSLSADMVKFMDKACEKQMVIQWLIFILFGASFSTSVNKLYLIRNRGVSRTHAKSKMDNGFQPLTFAAKSSILDFVVVLDTPMRRELFPFLLSKANHYLKI